MFLHCRGRARPIPHASYVVVLQHTVEVLRGVIVVVVDEELPDLLLEAHAPDRGFHPGNGVVGEVERRCPKVDVELPCLGAHGTGAVSCRSSGTPDGGNPGKRVSHNFADRGGDIDDDPSLVGVERFQGGEL